MARRAVLLSASFLLGLAPLAQAAPAQELAAVPTLPASAAPVTLQGFLERIRRPAAAAVPAAASPTAGYVPRTAHDNSPYRFDMTQNGRRMTADEFDAWMKARGIRVATGKPATPAPAESAAAQAQPTAASAPAPAACQPSATLTC
ncbi:MAG: hypothetical protein KatS3mg127_1008 [Silanimonas sp.]|nr:MAG: hypothetical protein KatS3mg127_1008 [Silanimonas sp.]